MAPVTTRWAHLGAAAFVAAALCASCGTDGASGPAATLAAGVAIAPPISISTDGDLAQLGVEVLATHPHDSAAYTQGLAYAEPDRLYETTGRYGLSSLREVSISSGSVLRNQSFDDEYFGEGLALSDGRLIALTWREHTALAFEPSSFEQVDSFGYDTEGWGLCDDGDRLVMSDGTATLTFRDQQTFAPTGTVTVTQDDQPLPQLNELECVDGLVYANVYLTDRIVVIDPATGAVVADIDASGLLTPEQAGGLERGEVLNGIAFDPDRQVFYLTGKNWPSLFEVRFVER